MNFTLKILNFQCRDKPATRLACFLWLCWAVYKLAQAERTLTVRRV